MGGKAMGMTGWVVVTTMFGAVSAHAVDQGITGKKLQLKDPSKVKVLSKDSTISIMGSDPVSGADSSITFDDGTNSSTTVLPASGWSANGAGTKFKYTADSGVVTGIKIGAGKLKVKGKALPFAVPNGAATIDVTLTLDGGTNSYCMSFSGMGDGSKFAVKDAAAGSCAPAQTCGNNVQEGTETCDGTADAACPGNCLPDCTCAVCGNNIQEGTEACDGTADAACPGNCLPGCTCAVCGNNVREGQEECDGTQDANCVGACDSQCRCDISSSCGGGPCLACGAGCPSPYTCAGLGPCACIWLTEYGCATPCAPPYTEVDNGGNKFCVHQCGTAPACGGECGTAQTCTESVLGFCSCENNP